MNTTEILINKYAQLPADLKTEALHYIDYLLTKVKASIYVQTENEDDLSAEQKNALIRRYESLESNPEKGINWQVAREKLVTKYEKTIQ